LKKYKVKGMMCAACSQKVERAVKSIPGIKYSSVNLLSGVLTVDGAEDEAVISAVRRAGYDCAQMDGNSAMPVDNTDVIRGSARRLVFSLFFLVFLMYVSMGHLMWGFPLPAFIENSPITISLIQLVLSGVVLIINRRFFINGFRGLIKLAPNMDSLIAIGSFTAYFWSVIVVFKIAFEENTVISHGYLHELYFESAAMILALISLGKMLEEMAKGKTGSAIKSLM
jgi:Cu2+-exporting ATPase